jgi:hypothetical protein
MNIIILVLFFYTFAPGMINEHIKSIYRDQWLVKTFLASTLITLIGCVLSWIKLEGFAVFASTDITKFVINGKIITVVTSIISVMWLLSGLVIHQRNIRFVSISSILVMLIFFYMSYSVFTKETDNSDNIKGGMIILLCGLSYIIPILLALKNNFKCLFMNINLTLFYLLFVLLYLIVKFNDDGIKAIGFNLQYGLYITSLGTLVGLATSIILTVKIKKNAHKKEPVAKVTQETSDTFANTEQNTQPEEEV